MDSPMNDPNGMLRTLLRIHNNRELFSLLLDAGERYNLQSVDRLPLPIRPRLELLSVASNPLSLKHLSRLATRQHLTDVTPENIQTLPIPSRLKEYLLFKF